MKTIKTRYASITKSGLKNNRVRKYFPKIFIAFIFISNFGFASNYPLEVLQPQENLDVANRFYKAYPGLEYNVRMAVIGGKYPFAYALTDAPAGMSINSSTGEIVWPMPSVSGTPYDVTATVTDAENTTETVSWTILVTTEGFLFVDAVNGTAATAGGTGTIGNPWKTFKDVYGGDTYEDKSKNHKEGYFVYWRAGTYEMDGYISDDGWDGLSATMKGNRKPQVWLGYPGDTMPIIALANAHLYFTGAGRDIWIDGLDFRSDGNKRGFGIKIASEKDNVVFRRNKHSGITGGYEGGNNSLLFINRWGRGGNFTIQDSEFSDVDTGYGILNYNTKKVLVENNLFHHLGDHGVGTKVSAERWDIRGNRFRNNPRFSINFYYFGKDLLLSGDSEISYNVIEAGGGKVVVNARFIKIGLPVHIHRNTIMDNAEQTLVTANNGPFYWKNNVIINNSSSSDKIDRKEIVDPSRLIVKDNLLGTFADNIVDAQGNLTAEYEQFIGTRGHQLGGSGSKNAGDPAPKSSMGLGPQ